MLFERNLPHYELICTFSEMIDIHIHSLSSHSPSLSYTYSLPMEWLINEIAGNPALAGRVLHYIADANNDGTNGAQDLLAITSPYMKEVEDNSN